MQVYSVIISILEIWNLLSLNYRSYVQSEQEIFDAMRSGHYNRTWAATNMNEHSSRSHLVFCLGIEQKDTVKKTIKRGKLYLVDLAGSEKVWL